MLLRKSQGGAHSIMKKSKLRSGVGMGNCLIKRKENLDDCARLYPLPILLSQ